MTDEATTFLFSSSYLLPALTVPQTTLSDKLLLIASVKLCSAAGLLWGWMLKGLAASLDSKPEVLIVQWKSGFISGWVGAEEIQWEAALFQIDEEGWRALQRISGSFLGLFSCLFETVPCNLGWPTTQYGNKDDLELLTFLPPFPGHRDCRSVPLHRDFRLCHHIWFM